MSSILKALKKLEQEKAAQRGQKQDIAAGVLNNFAARERVPRWVFLSSLGGVAIVTALLTYILAGGHLSGNRKPDSPFSPAKVATPGDTQVPDARPLPEERASLPVNEVPAKGISGKSMRAGKASGSLKLPSTSSLVPSRLASISRTNARESGSVASERSTVSLPPEKTSAPVHTVTSLPSSPQLRVSGIAWQKDGTDSVAVVNGMSVSEGMTIEGVRVEQIRPDSVRFSHQGRTFDVGLGRSLPEK